MTLKHLMLTTFIATAALSLSSSAFADGRMHRGEMDGARHVMHQMMDSNKDGSVDTREFQAFRGQYFTIADKNRDGKLDAKEFSALPGIMEEQRKKAIEAARQEKAREHFTKMDSNGDGKVSKAEFDARGERQFIRKDHNDDGLLNREDRMGMMGMMDKQR